jgi:8-oxo-dGTP pyrophosphatase MutT (NUDIX family)
VVGAGGDDADGPTRANLQALVRAHRPVDDRERRAKQRFLAELERLAAPCDRHADPVHVTASAIVVGRRGVVLHLHRRIGRWMQPGGHLEPGEWPPEGALRETREETGLTVAHPPEGECLVHLDVHVVSAEHTHLDLRYLLLGADEDPAPPPDESPQVRWCTWEVAAQMADEALVGALVAARAKWVGRVEDWMASIDLGARGGGRAR